MTTFNNKIVYANTLLFLERRGFEMIEYTEADKNGAKPRMLAKSRDTDQLLSVFFVENSKVTIQVIKSILSTLVPTCHHIVIMYAYSLTPDARQIIFTQTDIFRFEVFHFDEMSYDPIELVPLHRKALEKPKEWIKLPHILTSDIVARYYGFQAGDVIMILESGNITYRRCV